VQGLARKYPVATASLVFAHLSISGFPLLAGFPSRLAIWQSLATDLSILFWVFVGMFGLLIAAFRTLAVFVTTDESGWKLNESWVQTAMLALGVSGLFILGLFPQILQSLLINAPALFEHLSQ
jgi:formate hydrogenlyase subunit 3/multisubunit Na+/H+ antiporter MnhD subunit